MRDSRGFQFITKQILEEALHSANDQDDGSGVSSIEPTRLKQDSDIDSNEHAAEDRDGFCFSFVLKSCMK